VPLGKACYGLFHSVHHLTWDLAIAKFSSGPPGGRTLPQTATRLSDLVGGVYGPGASVASTGMNAQRPAVKAGFARAAGETWEDVVEYFLVRMLVM
jgi:SEL1 protein